MNYMLDTNICIYLIRGRSQEILNKFKEFEFGDIGISSITFAELQYGVEKSEYKDQNRIALTNFLSPITILPFSDKAAVKYGKIRTLLGKKGGIIGAYDLLIAAHALAEDVVLVSNNTKEFERVPGLKLDNWV